MIDLSLEEELEEEEELDKAKILKSLSQCNFLKVVVVRGSSAAFGQVGAAAVEARGIARLVPTGAAAASGSTVMAAVARVGVVRA